MAKIFLIDFSSEILINVAMRLKEKGVEILYWTGRKRFFDQIVKNKEIFPKTIFHNNLDAVRAISAEDLRNAEFDPPGKELINEMLECESLTLTMMTRLDFRGQVPFLKKKHLYYKYLQYWNGVIGKLKPDMIIFRSTPHASYNFVLYWLAKKYSIKTMMFDSTVFMDKLLVLKDFRELPEEFMELIRKSKDNKYQITELPKDKQEYFEQLANLKIDATPDYKKQIIAQINDPVKVFPPIKKIIKNIKSGNFFPVLRYHIKSALNLTNRPIFTIDETDKADYHNIYQLKKIRKVMDKYKKEYKKAEQEVDFKRKYIYFPLHYQPECNTSPVGEHFADQILTVKILSSALPQGWIIYVKENTAQWNYRNAQANSFRYSGYYWELANIKSVSLVSPDVSSFDLAAQSQAVATISGTAGWESLVRGKPVLFFGHPWYQHCEGALSVGNSNDCRRAIEKIINGYKPDTQKILNYLIALDKSTIRASHVEYLERASGVPREESIKVITEAVWRKLTENEAPSGLRPRYLLPTLRREQNPSEAENSSRSSVSPTTRKFSAKGDKIHE
jgi:hypothetical protein